MMSRWLTFALIVGGLTVCCGDAWSQAAERKAFKEAVISSSPRPTSKSKKTYDFSDGTIDGKLGSGRMRRANRVASRILHQRMKRDRPGDLKLVREASAADVVVVRGSYDRVQDVLRAVGVKHVVIPPRLLAKVPLMSTQTVMVNCPGRLSKKGREKIQRFVKTGGYLVTTDWALTLVQRAFPGFVKRAGRNTGNDVVKVHVHDGSDEMLKHVKAARSNPRWWLESGSFPIKVLNRQKVKVLISSKEMARKYGQAPIAVTFRYDDGKVLHMTSHFYLQQAKLLSKRERAKGSSFAASAGIRGADLERLRKDGLDKVRAGELNSAYSMQQVTTNVLVGKAKDNKKLLKRFRRRAAKRFKLQGGDVKEDFLLRVIDRKGKKVKVRDLFGREGWTDRANVK